tara:strand:+ start:332 stop:523 length:192 start_codon:yes stop_codon:yes gene_type:complete
MWTLLPYSFHCRRYFVFARITKYHALIRHSEGNKFLLVSRPIIKLPKVYFGVELCVTRTNKTF